MFPCDEVSAPCCHGCSSTRCSLSGQQEKNRLDIFHKFFLVARQDQLHSAPLHPLPPDEKHMILDLGTGTGIWAIDMAM